MRILENQCFSIYQQIQIVAIKKSCTFAGSEFREQHSQSFLFRGHPCLLLRQLDTWIVLCGTGSLGMFAIASDMCRSPDESTHNWTSFLSQIFKVLPCCIIKKSSVLVGDTSAKEPQPGSLLTMEMLREAEKPAIIIGYIEPDTVTNFIATAHPCRRV